MPDENDDPLIQHNNHNSDSGIKPGDANAIPALPSNLISKCGKEEGATILENISEDSRYHRFGCYCDIGTFEAKTIDEATENVNKTRLQCIVDDNNNDFVTDIEKNFLKLDLDYLLESNLKKDRNLGDQSFGVLVGLHLSQN